MSEKFPHLDWNINVKTIEKVLVYLLDEDKLPESKRHFNRIKEEHFSNIQIVTAVDNIIFQIDDIMKWWKGRKLWEINEAANNPVYWDSMVA